MVIRKRKSKRTDEQNHRLWALYRSVGSHIGYTEDDVHQLMGFKFLREQKTINGENVSVIKSTTHLTIKQMREYQEKIELWASQIGWAWEYESMDL